ncbi:unnamed protein product [Moneuplotes crassus]|uniref:Uncharacterized protein n=1 Tax=Euplotes crassus TaxID=5936 RepID=A0AAD1Y8A2_EUPCR|nr:unnamed protein product [Moneuplotes crassus]
MEMKMQYSKATEPQQKVLEYIDSQTQGTTLKTLDEFITLSRTKCTDYCYESIINESREELSKESRTALEKQCVKTCIRKYTNVRDLYKEF